MNTLAWFSSKMRLVCLIEGQGGTRYQDSVYLFQAYSFDDAFKRAVAIAKRNEEQFKNMDGMNVLWRAVSIISLDHLGEHLSGEIEVYSEPTEIDSGIVIPCGAQFAIENSEPTQTV